MIWTVVVVNARRLMHNRVELVLTFLVPIAFFSIFAVIFGSGVSSTSTSAIKVVAIDESKSEASGDVLRLLRENPGLRFMRDRDDAVTREIGSRMVRHGTATMAIVLHGRNDSLAVDLLADSSDQVAGQVVSAFVGRSLMMAQAKQQSDQAKVFASSIASSEPAKNPIQHVAAKPTPHPTETSTVRAEENLDATVGEEEASSTEIATPLDSSTLASDPMTTGLDESSIRLVDVMGSSKANPIISMYAAGIAVMFLLFGATGGGGALLEGRENQTLERLLSTRMTMDQLLLGKWFYLTALGVLQVSVMFLWGQIIFGIDLLGHLDGFVMMTVVTSSAAAAFGLCLATLCKSRGQLNGLSVILVLTMSALGGSMVPRYVMSDSLREAGLWTFNAWALDGYDKVFWRELPVRELWPQLSVLMVAAVVFLMTARAFAIRWESD